MTYKEELENKIKEFRANNIRLMRRNEEAYFAVRNLANVLSKITEGWFLVRVWDQRFDDEVSMFCTRIGGWNCAYAVDPETEHTYIVFKNQEDAAKAMILFT